MQLIHALFRRTCSGRSYSTDPIPPHTNRRLSVIQNCVLVPFSAFAIYDNTYIILYPGGFVKGFLVFFQSEPISVFLIVTGRTASKTA